MREPTPDRYFNPNQRLIDEIELKSEELYSLLVDIINNESSLYTDAHRPIDSLTKLKVAIRSMNIDRVEELIDKIL